MTKLTAFYLRNVDQGFATFPRNLKAISHGFLFAINFPEEIRAWDQQLSSFILPKIHWRLGPLFINTVLIYGYVMDM